MSKKNLRTHICTNCGHVGFPIKHVPGSFIIELGLWFFMILPGFLYTLWRLFNTSMVCPECKKDFMIKASSPNGKELLLLLKQNNANKT